MTALRSADVADDLAGDIDLPRDRTAATAGYQSPLLSRLSDGGRLTLELLRENVPALKAGHHASQQLAEGGPDQADRALLQAAVRAGEVAKERLVLAAMPLIKHLAQKEHTRRRGWQTQVTFDDLFQEGMYGLLRGLLAYNPDGGQTSPTNYLGQWITVQMRRNVESVDNDFEVPYESAERFRRIRALRSRLAGELGRSPSEEEILTASVDPTYRTQSKLGRSKASKEATGSGGKALTAAHLAEEQQMSARVGATGRYLDDGDEHTPGFATVDYARPLTGETFGSAEQVVEQGARDGLAQVLQQTLHAMGLPPLQRDVIARRYGLPPREGEQTARDIAGQVGLRRERVSEVLEAFTAEMSRPGGCFHQVCAQLDPDEAADLGLSWVGQSLGEWQDVAGVAPQDTLPSVLTGALQVRAGAVPPPPPIVPHQRGPQTRAQFQCTYHGRGFVGMYPTRSVVPQQRACPQCGGASPLIRVLTT
jgi:RNA polymerase sigma factor (sigma-70 family)